MFAAPMRRGPEPEPPHAVLVYRGSMSGDGSAAVERITFENAESSKIIEVAKGPPTRASATMRAPQNPERVRSTGRGPGSDRPAIDDD